MEFQDFARQHGHRLRQLAYLVCGDAGRAEDAAQTALEKVYVRRRSLDDPLTYARRVAVNAARDNWRRHGRREEIGASAPESVSTPSETTEDRDLLLSALRQLPRRQREVVVLRHWMDLSEQETADTLGLSVGTVKSHNSRALSALRALVPSPSGTERS